jgi:hypothetical protein
MKWAMKKGVGISRSASVWLLSTKIDPSPEFFLLEGADAAIVEEAHRLGAKTIHVKGGDFVTSETPEGGRIDTVQKLLVHFDLLGKDPALDLWAEIVRDAEGPVKKGAPSHPEAFGVYCLVQGYKAAIADDARRMEILPLQFAALYEWCRKVVAGDIVPPRVSPHGELGGTVPGTVPPSSRGPTS